MTIMHEEEYWQEKQWVEAFEDDNIPDEKIIELIHILADSGKKFVFDDKVYDFASTGGPSSLSTILVPLYLYACGVSVINIAVPGRPAGAIDVLSQIPNYHMDGYDTHISKGVPFYLHLEAGSDFAPLDKKLFEYRKIVNKVNNPRLAIASLLSKKVAGGASNIGLDVRVAPFGNFGTSWNECRTNAKRYNQIAKQLGFESTCFLCDASVPLQPFIGRGEALVALHNIANMQDDGFLQDHNKYCMNIANTMTAGNVNVQAFKTVFCDNLAFQGSTYEQFEEKVARIKNQPYYTYCANKNGYIKYNLSSIRQYLVHRQNLASGMSGYSDPSGMILLCRGGEYVEKNQPILRIRNSIKSLEDEYCFYMIEDATIVNIHESEVI